MLRLRLLSLLMLLIFITSCNTKEARKEGSPVSTPEPEKIPAVRVFYFLSPECPLCQSYTPLIRELQEKYNPKGYIFFAVFPGNQYSETEVKTFLHDYNLKIPVIMDTDKKLTHTLGASITPEVFIMGAHDEILYSGRIDNWAWETGQKRLKATEHDLVDALNAIDAGAATYQKKTQAVGCIIEK